MSYNIILLASLSVRKESPKALNPLTDMDFVGHRQRSYTAQRLEVMRREKKNASKVKRVIWKHNTAPIDGKDSCASQ